jgi:hypothetical protein
MTYLPPPLKPPRAFEAAARHLSFILFFNAFDELLFAASPRFVRSLDLAYQSFHFYGAPHQYQEADFITSIRRTFYTRTAAPSYDAKSWPALDLSYQPLSWNKNVHSISPDDVIGAPGGIAQSYQWFDYFGDGAPGIITEQDNRWYFKSNLGDGARHCREAVIHRRG